ncbi:hypothetical protein ACFQX6_60190 [Streptosporangium lutulentum]
MGKTGGSSGAVAERRHVDADLAAATPSSSFSDRPLPQAHGPT